jgi:hypothetical protein
MHLVSRALATLRFNYFSVSVKSLVFFECVVGFARSKMIDSVGKSVETFPILQICGKLFLVSLFTGCSFFRFDVDDNLLQTVFIRLFGTTLS